MTARKTGYVCDTCGAPMTLVYEWLGQVAAFRCQHAQDAWQAAMDDARRQWNDARRKVDAEHRDHTRVVRLPWPRDPA